MFQQTPDLPDATSLGPITNELSKKPRLCNGHILAKGLNSKRLSNFSDMSEILDGPGLLTGRLKSGNSVTGKEVAIRLLALEARCQNLSEMPPRTDRRLLPTKVITSAFSELVCTSSRLRASTIASARTGKPNVGSSCVT